MEESILVQRAKQGDKKSLENLLKINYPIVKGYLLKTTLNQSLTDDLTQETMLKAILKLKSFENRAKFSTWLITIATNLYRDYLRKNNRLTEIKEEDENMTSCKSAENFNPEEIITKKLELGTVLSKLKELPEEKRTALVLKHYYDYKYEEIARIMDCPVGTVRSRIHDAVKTLRKNIKEG